MAFGMWGYLVSTIGMAVATIASLTIGIVVDDTVHFMSKYLRARRENSLAPEDAVRYAFRTVGKALWGTSIILVLGFLVMSLSTFRMNWTMGALSAMTIGLALFADFLLLPALLLAADKRGAGNTGTNPQLNADGDLAAEA